MPSLETMQLLRAAADACDSRKAEDILILALDPAESSLTDYFLICNGTNERQNVAISDEIEHRLKQDFNTFPNSVEGRRQGEWVLMDYVDFVVHIFMPERRAYYGLERLRKSATTLSLAHLNVEIKEAIAATRTRAVKRSSEPKKISVKSSARSAIKKAVPRKTATKRSSTAKATPKPSPKKTL